MVTQYDNVEEIVLDEEPAKNRFDAACKECSTIARLNTPGVQRELGETFEMHCYSCNSGRFSGLGETNLFRVVDRSPDPDSYPNESFDPPVYTADDSN